MKLACCFMLPGTETTIATTTIACMLWEI
jgi:hypothetical protein